MYLVVGQTSLRKLKSNERNGTDMAITNPTFTQHIVLQRFRTTDGYTGCWIIAPSLGLRMFGAVLGRFPFASGLGHGRIVSISRGSPPHKKR